jgi:membrane protein
VDRIVGGIDSARRRSRRFNHVWCAGERFGEVLGGRLAAAIAYYGFFAVFALALLAYSVLGYVLRVNQTVYSAVNDFLTVNLPWLEPTTIQGSAGKAGVIGLIGLVVTGIGWIEAIRSSQRLMHGVEQQPGNPITRRLVDLVVLVGLFVLIALSLAVAYAVEWLVGWLVGDSSVALAIVAWVLTVVVNIVLAAALLGGVPRLHLPVRRLVPAVIFVAAGITLLNTVGQAVVDRVRTNPAYTVMTSAVGVLVYLYLLNQVLLFGAALIATSSHGRVRDLANRGSGSDADPGSGPGSGSGSGSG